MPAAWRSHTEMEEQNREFPIYWDTYRAGLGDYGGVEPSAVFREASTRRERWEEPHEHMGLA